MIRFRLYLLLYLILSSVGGLFAQVHDSIRFSLLTCDPGQEIYELFGHTAIRYQNFTRQIDDVYNYGMFNFRAPNFVMRFVKGETDYELGIIPYPYFYAEYAQRGSSVYEQELNLSYWEKEKLINLLTANYTKPENRIYRYNYFYDNCTTRARDIIEMAIRGKVVYPDGDDNVTFRSIIHEFTAESPWDELGIDLCLGREADRPISTRLQQFAPLRMLHSASKAYITDSVGNQRLLVINQRKIVDAQADNRTDFPLSPLVCSILLSLCIIGLSYRQYRIKKIYLWLDVAIYGIKGVAGCIIAFLFFFSVHPTVNSNLMILFFNPCSLLWLPFVSEVRSVRYKYAIWMIICGVLTLFIVIFILGLQKFNLSVLPLAFAFWVNALSHVLLYKKE